MSALMSGCSGIKTYPNKLEKNLNVEIEKDSGSFFSSIKTAVDIYTINKDCSTEYAGTVQLRKPTAEIGIPTGRSSYLAFVFHESGFLSSTSSTTTFDTMIRPRKGYSYSAKVSYMDDIYNVELFEKKAGRKKGREIETRDLSSCRPVEARKK
jgi:hypothetical protein